MERALGEEAMLAALHGLRLPAEAAGGAPAETLAGLGLGLLLAALIGRTIRAGLIRRPREDLPEGLDDEARRLLLLRRLKAEAPERYAALAGGLYRPGGLPGEAAIRAAMER